MYAHVYEFLQMKPLLKYMHVYIYAQVSISPGSLSYLYSRYYWCETKSDSSKMQLLVSLSLLPDIFLTVIWVISVLLCDLPHRAGGQRYQYTQYRLVSHSFPVSVTTTVYHLGNVFTFYLAVLGCFDPFFSPKIISAIISVWLHQEIILVNYGLSHWQLGLSLQL